MQYIQRVMLAFGLQSSLFDVATFVLLLVYFHADQFSFQSGWFTESLITEILILLVIRTRLHIWQSRPGRLLLGLTIAILLLAIVLPYLPFAAYFELRPLPLSMLVAILLVVFLYLITAEGIKRLVLKPT